MCRRYLGGSYCRKQARQQYNDPSLHKLIHEVLPLLQPGLQVVLYIVLRQVLHQGTVGRQVEEAEVEGFAEEVLLVVDLRVPL